jgi:hypothetical protein
MEFIQACQQFLHAINEENHHFKDTLTFIDTWYEFSPTAFFNGPVKNGIEENQGSAKVLALGIDLNLSTDQVLRCFGEHYREVLATPGVDNHFNLRRLMKDGFGDVSFEAYPLKRK